MKMAVRSFSFGTIGLRGMSAMLSLSAERVRQLAAECVLVKTGRDVFEIEGSVQGYLRYLQEDAKRRSHPEKDALMRAKRKAIESKIERIIANAIERDDVEAWIADVVAIYRAEFAGLGETCCGDDGLATKIDRQTEAAIARCERALRRAVGRLK